VDWIARRFSLIILDGIKDDATWDESGLEYIGLDLDINGIILYKQI
jgi:hypothetical protein